MGGRQTRERCRHRAECAVDAGQRVFTQPPLHGTPADQHVRDKAPERAAVHQRDGRRLPLGIRHQALRHGQAVHDVQRGCAVRQVWPTGYGK